MRLTQKSRLSQCTTGRCQRANPYDDRLYFVLIASTKTQFNTILRKRRRGRVLCHRQPKGLGFLNARTDQFHLNKPCDTEFAPIASR